VVATGRLVVIVIQLICRYILLFPNLTRMKGICEAKPVAREYSTTFDLEMAGIFYDLQFLSEKGNL